MLTLYAWGHLLEHKHPNIHQDLSLPWSQQASRICLLPPLHDRTPSLVTWSHFLNHLPRPVIHQVQLHLNAWHPSFSFSRHASCHAGASDAQDTFYSFPRSLGTPSFSDLTHPSGTILLKCSLSPAHVALDSFWFALAFAFKVLQNHPALLSG